MKKSVAKAIKPRISNDTKPAAQVIKIAMGPTKGKGRGVFCTYPIKQGELVEYAPVIPMPKKDVIPDSVFDDYVLCWGEDTDDEQYCMVGGYVMLYNHSKTPTVALANDTENLSIRVTALRDIMPGDEITWNYNCDIWFDVED